MKVLISMLALTLVLSMALPAVAEDAAALYKTKCQACHGPDGNGTKVGKTMGAKPFSTVADRPDKDLIEITTNGKEKMPAYKGKLTEEQIKGLVAYVKTLK